MENLPVSTVYAAVIILRSGVIRPCCLPPYTTAFVRYYNLESGRAAVANMDGRVMGGCRLAAMLYFPIQIRM
uniref:RRM domain-containing protein n=1 Tax=Echinococcus granulosus TaxID=6210 RepID=A0A068X4H6_ECHGR|nr:hypothetical protein EgrG_001160300 [Echinococcus granulosus]